MADEIRDTFLDRALDRLGAALQDREHRRGFLRAGWRLVRALFSILSLSYALALCFGLAALHWWAEDNIASAFLLFVPPQIWAVPSLALVFPSLLLRPSLCLLHLACAALVILGFMDWQHRDPLARSATSLTLLSNNRGEHGRESMTPFVEREAPDVIAFQEESVYRAARFAKSYTGYTVEGQSEFLLLSKFPVRASGPIDLPSNKSPRPVAAWFEIDFRGTPVVIFNVHLPTPRDTLYALGRKSFLLGIVGLPGTPWAEKRRHYQEYWDWRMQLATELKAVVAREQRPFIVAGDFNTPDHGTIYHLVSKGLQDSHEVRGQGFGFTFPGYTNNPVAMFRPWLRLDYMFASPHWTVLSSKVEPDRRSQHRSVVGSFELPAK